MGRILLDVHCRIPGVCRAKIQLSEDLPSATDHEPVAIDTVGEELRGPGLNAELALRRFEAFIAAVKVVRAAPAYTGQSEYSTFSNGTRRRVLP